MPKSALLLTLLVLSGVGCAVQHTSDFTSKPLLSRPAVDGNPRLCLALSGGGIRAGSTALGVLQRLHELGALKEFAYVTAVSGGGYPVYGLIYELTRKKQSLDELLGEDGKFLARVERNSEFITFASLATKLVVSTALVPIDKPLHWVQPRPGRVLMSNGSASYQANIHGTFTGSLIPMWGTPKLYEIQELRSKGFPYPIFLASANKGSGAPSDRHVYSVADLFELSPNWIGSDNSGYWYDFRTDLRLENVISMSAAAVDAPDLDYDNIDAPLPKFLKRLSLGLGGYVTLGDGKNVYLADGGFIENQALLPLVKRGCKKIISLDATSDDTASFRAVKRVQGYLRADGWQVSEIRPVKPITTVVAASGWDLPSHLWSFNVSHESEALSSDIVILKLGIVRNHSYPILTEAYLQGALMTANNNLRCEGSGLSQSCDFLLEATAQQSYTTEEFRAYRHLGKHLVDLWKEVEQGE